MIFDNGLVNAILRATLSHGDQVDKSGEPYILHPLSVMFRVRAAGDEEIVQIVAVLHDTVEDTNLTINQIRETFGDVVAASVDAISRRDGETYREYLVRVKANRIALIVKVQDLHDNLDPDRHLWVQDATDAAELTRLKARYVEALRFLGSNRP